MRKVIATSVIRAAEKGNSHGGVYIVDLDSKKSEKVIDWSDPNIKWDGRGGERGLRGICFYDNKLYIATSEAICCFDKSFKQTNIYHNDNLGQCHEICTHNDKIYISSTSYNIIVEFYPISEKFIKGFGKLQSSSVVDLDINKKFKINMHHHLNNIFSDGEKLYFSESGGRFLYMLENDKVNKFASIQASTHNVQPYKDGVLYNNTGRNRIIYGTLKGKQIECFNIKQHIKKYFINGFMSDKIARTGFARGLCIMDDYIIGGSSPANISVYEHGKVDAIDIIFLSNDVRNSIHGLEVLPEGW